jgi:oxygen-dependent protoporphyrinogen oxidase
MIKNQKRTQVTIIGAGLTGLTLAFYLKKAGLDIKLIEKSNRVGGVIQTHYEDSFVYETGPNSGVLSTPESVELFEDLVNDCQIEKANENSKARWIWKSGKWEPLPSGFVEGIKTPLFKFSDKIGMVKEPFTKKGNNPNESVADLVRRRLGESFLHYAVDPFISGIYAGDPEKLITKYALPKLYNLEQEYGSFIRGAMKKKSLPKSEREKKVTREVFSVKNGLQNLIEALEKHISKENIFTDVDEISISGQSPFKVMINHKKESINFDSDIVITTGSGYTLEKILPDIDQSLIQNITNLKYAKVAQVIFGYKVWKGIELKSFGGLVPEKENKNILGILFLSSIFSNRAPKGGALLSTFIGGARKPELINLSDDDLLQKVKSDILEMTGLKKFNPDLLKIVRYQNAIPQYEISSKERYQAIEQIQDENPGLILAGNIRDGIGMSDRIAQARQIADSVIEKIENE